MGTKSQSDSLEEQIADLQRQLDRIEQRVAQGSGGCGVGCYFWIVIGLLALVLLSIHDVKGVLDRVLRPAADRVSRQLPRGFPTSALTFPAEGLQCDHSLVDLRALCTDSPPSPTIPASHESTNSHRSATLLLYSNRSVSGSQQLCPALYIER